VRHPRFSIIIPAYNEEAYLPRLLDSIDAARLNSASGSHTVEVIVADNASTDQTAEIARSRNCRVAFVTTRAIAAARNGRAAVAAGDILCFIDADSAIHPDSLNAIDAAMSDGRFVAGATGVALERWSPGLVATYCVMAPIAWATGMDTGIVFCRRADFETVGGYDETYLYGEDVRFLWALRTLGKARGQTLTRLSGVQALASTRKFDQKGDWHYFVLFFRTVVGFITGRRTDQMQASDYWYKPER
jgi:glycosyltransferase involved in cell wall biosynthesis